MTRTRAVRRLGALALLAIGLASFAAGGKIWVKARLAQWLLHRAWAETRVTGEPVPPWPWADTWPVARLAVPRLGVDLIVLAGVSGRTMAFGPGQLPGSAAPGAPGNTVLAGHRDTQFRFLKDLGPGDEIRLTGPDGTPHAYAVTDTRVVDATETWLLGQTAARRLTLITCFPFDAVRPGGPQRYVVRAGPVAPSGPRAGAR